MLICGLIRYDMLKFILAIKMWTPAAKVHETMETRFLFETFLLAKKKKKKLVQEVEKHD